MLAPLWPPRTFELTLSEAPNVPAAGGYPLVAYCGERAAFFLLFYSYYSAWLLYLAAAGIATLVTLAAVLEEEEHRREPLQHGEGRARRLLGPHAAGPRDAQWTRRERMLARRWDVADRRGVGRAPRPQFVGVWRTHPVTGERELWASPLARVEVRAQRPALDRHARRGHRDSDAARGLRRRGDRPPRHLDSAFEVLSAVYTAVAVSSSGGAARSRGG